MPATWGGRSSFNYTGSVTTGTDITYGNGRIARVTAKQYADLRKHFLNRSVPAGLSRTASPTNSLGAWLQANVTQTAIATYVARILELEGYAVRVGRSDIRVT